MTWGTYQRMITAYHEPDRTRGPDLTPGTCPHEHAERVPQRRRPTRADRAHPFGRTQTKRALDVLAYVDRPGTSNGPTEAINGRLEHLRGSAVGFHNLTNYIARSLLESGGFRPRLHPRL